MRYTDCIAVSMEAITKISDKGLKITNPDNLNHIKLRLAGGGFVLEEVPVLNTKPTYGEIETMVSPHFFIKTLFNGGVIGKNSEELANKNFLADYIRNDFHIGLKDHISYIRFVEAIDNLLNCGNKGLDLRFKEAINCHKEFRLLLDEYASLGATSQISQVINYLKDLNYKEALIAIHNRLRFLRQLERLYQVEVLLTNYSKARVLRNMGKVGYEQPLAQIPSIRLDRVNLAEHETGFAEFCQMIYEINQLQENLVNEEWLNCLSNNQDKTVMGLDEIILPFSPKRPEDIQKDRHGYTFVK